MWMASLKSTTKGSVFEEAARKFNITSTGYPISYQRQGKKMLVQLAGLIMGTDQDKSKFIKHIKKLKEVRRLSVNKDFLVTLVEQPLENIALYSPEIVWVKPAIISNGYEYLEIASWDKQQINNLISCLEKYGCELLKLKRGKISDIYITSIMPKMTDKQKQAFKLAVEYGYYEFPKKIELKQLAKMMGVSYSTYQAHLKKAENKIMPFILKRI